MTYMSLSGDVYSTGKSLIADACMNALYGRKLDCTAPTQVSVLYEMLASGTPIYGKKYCLEAGEWGDVIAKNNLCRQKQQQKHGDIYMQNWGHTNLFLFLNLLLVEAAVPPLL